MAKPHSALNEILKKFPEPQISNKDFYTLRQFPHGLNPD
jgi:hypothetical protein